MKMRATDFVRMKMLYSSGSWDVLYDPFTDLI